VTERIEPQPAQCPEPTPEKHAGGRPSDYEPAYCDGVVAFMGQGYSLTAYAGEIGVCRDTLNEWGRAHAEFSDAVKRGKAARTRKLEETLLAGETGPRVTAHIFALKNAAPEEWKEKVAIVGGEPTDPPVRSELTIRFVDAATPGEA
jgi:hypothetical protein